MGCWCILQKKVKPVEFLSFWVKTIRLLIARIGAIWMRTLMTSNLNRVSIAKLGTLAMLVTLLNGLQHFISLLTVIARKAHEL